MKKKSARTHARKSRVVHKATHRSVHPLHRVLPVNTGVAVTILLVGFVILALVASRY